MTLGFLAGYHDTDIKPRYITINHSLASSSTAWSKTTNDSTTTVFLTKPCIGTLWQQGKTQWNADNLTDARLFLSACQLNISVKLKAVYRLILQPNPTSHCIRVCWMLIPATTSDSVSSFRPNTSAVNASCDSCQRDIQNSFNFCYL